MFGKILCMLGCHKIIKVYPTRFHQEWALFEVHCERCKKILSVKATKEKE
jgi:lysyl-tRNA synthetase class I